MTAADAIRAQREFARETQILMQQLAQQSQGLATAQIQVIAAQSALQATGGMAELIGSFAAAMAEQVSSGNGDLKKVYEAAAREGQAAMLRKYKATRKTHGLHYRGEDSGDYKRYTGVMERLLEQGQAFFRINDSGVDFIMPQLLDRAAPQWYRLNFGASPAPSAAVRKGNIMFFGTSVPGPALDGFRPSAAFRIPPGVWSMQLLAQTASLRGERSAERPGLFATGRIEGAGSGGKPASGKPLNLMNHTKGGSGVAFYPSSQMNNPVFGAETARMTRGIVGGRFFDAGLAEFNHKLGWGLEVMVEQWVEDARAQSAGQRRSNPMSLNHSAAEKQAAKIQTYFSQHASQDRLRYQQRLRLSMANRRV